MGLEAAVLAQAFAITGGIVDLVNRLLRLKPGENAEAKKLTDEIVRAAQVSESEKARLRNENDTLRAEKEALRVEREAMRGERDAALLENVSYRDQNARLVETMRFKKRLVFHHSMLWAADEPDAPYCATCWESKGLAVHLQQDVWFRRCWSCKGEFSLWTPDDH